MILEEIWYNTIQGCTNCGSLAAKKWRENEKMKRKWREIHSLNFLMFSLFPPSPSYILYPISKIVSLCRKMLNAALLSRMSLKNLTYALWENILGRIRCEKAPQVVTAWYDIIHNILTIIWRGGQCRISFFICSWNLNNDIFMNIDIIQGV